MTTEPEFDRLRLDQLLRARLDGLRGPLDLQRISGGQSNPTFFASYENRRLVVRKQPPGPLMPSAHAIDREYRVQSALAATNVAVPHLLFYEADAAIIGTPFYVMERLDGRVFADGALSGVTAAERGAMYQSMAETMARLHRVDYAAIGLGDYGRPGNYFARQIARWTRQWELAAQPAIPEITDLLAWLPANIPPEDAATLCHGDLRTGNMMFHPTEPRVIALLDWELSTIGHPLSDLAYNAMAWRTTPDEYGGIRGLDLRGLGIPGETEYLAHYVRAGGHSAPVLPFHFAFVMFRFAVIFAGIAARAAAGNAASENAAEVGGRLTRALARRGIEAITPAGYRAPD
ncbi:MAG: phosphotransferase family protein [Acetobacteraceae bacterium]|nr:phosphotransferase family protein [Acetobacteraceae bacterium]